MHDGGNIYVLTTNNGVTINETPLTSIDHGKDILAVVFQRLKRHCYNPLLICNGTGLVYNVETVNEYGAENNHIEIGICTR